jgi:hypothetical protein
MYETNIYATNRPGNEEVLPREKAYNEPGNGLLYV